MTLPVADIGIAWLLLIVIVGSIVGLVVISFFHKGSGADLLDWPSNQSMDRLVREDEDFSQMVAAENRHRREQGLPELSEDDVRLRGVDALRRER